MMTASRQPAPRWPAVVLDHQPVTETWTLTLACPGPAGSLTLQLPDGVLVWTDLLMRDQPLQLQFSCDRRGQWPDGIETLAALLFGDPVADALDRNQTGPAPYHPPDSLRRHALLQLINTTGRLGRLPALANAEALELARTAGQADSAYGEIPILLHAATRFAAAAARALRLLPSTIGLHAPPTAASSFYGLKRLIGEELGDEVRLAAPGPALVEARAGWIDSPRLAERPVERVLVGNQDGGHQPSTVLLLPSDGMRLPLSVRGGDHQPNISLERITDDEDTGWVLTAPLRVKGLPAPWVRVSDEYGAPLLHVRARLVSGQVQASLPDLSSLNAGPVWLELLVDPMQEMLSPTASRRVAAMQEAARAMGADASGVSGDEIAEHWSECARSWLSVGEQGNALTAFDLAARATHDPRRRRRYTTAGEAVRSRARSSDLTSYIVYQNWLDSLPIEPAAYPVMGPPPVLLAADISALQAIIDEWVCTELNRLADQPPSGGEDLRGLAEYWQAIAAVGTPTNAQVHQCRTHTGLVLATEARKRGLHPLARALYANVIARDDESSSAPDPATTRLLTELADTLHRDWLDDDAE